MTGILKVDAIQNNTGTSVMTFDADGRITTPNRPSFFATRSAGLYNTNNGTIVFNSVQHNDGDHYNSATGIFTAPIAGNYLLTFSLISGNTSLVEGEIAINNSRRLNQRNYSSSNGTQNGVSGAMVIKLQANDTAKVILHGNSSVYGQAGYYDTFSGCLIG